MNGQRSYLVCYDIADQKRLHKVEKILAGYGYRVQFSIFLCLLTNLLKASLMRDISAVINENHDQCVIMDLGNDPDILEKADTIGKKIIKIPKITII